MHVDRLEFDKILKALEKTYEELQTEELSIAKQNCLEALAFSASVDQYK